MMGVFCARQFQHLPFWPTLSDQSTTRTFDTISVHDRAHLLRGQIQRYLAIVRLDKAMTISMALHLTNDFTMRLTESCLGLVMGFILMLELHSSLLRRDFK